jgi:hypothetical protein
MSEWAWPGPRSTTPPDKGTIETLHLLLQLVGKLPLRLHPWLNHGWHVALRLSPRGSPRAACRRASGTSRSSSTCSTARCGRVRQRLAIVSAESRA